MKVLIVGGAGYIGSHVAREFLDRGHSVTVFDNLSSGLRGNIFIDEQFIEGDILDYEKLLHAMQSNSFSALIHLAAFKAAGESMIAPEKYSHNNITGSINILNAALKANIKNIVFSSSAAVYGEPQYTPIDEKHPTNPENYYGFTKLEIERIMSWYDKLKGIRFASLRYFNAAGYDPKGRICGLERNPANLLPIVMEAASGIRKNVEVFGSDYNTPDGTCIRDYIHVSDLAIGHILALEYIMSYNKSLTVNLGSETGVSVLEMIETAKKVTGVNIPFKVVDRRAGDPAKLTSSALFAKETLKWQAQYSDVKTLISSTWDIYKKNNIGGC